MESNIKWGRCGECGKVTRILMFNLPNLFYLIYNSFLPIYDRSTCTILFAYSHFVDLLLAILHHLYTQDCEEIWTDIFVKSIYIDNFRTVDLLTFSIQPRP